MKILYIECKMGAAGDMLMAALYELLSEEQKAYFLTTMQNAFGDAMRVVPEDAMSCGICGTRMHVYIDGKEEGADGDGHFHHSHVHEHTHEHTHGHEHTHEHSKTHEHTDAENHTDTHVHAHHSYTSILEQIHQLPLPKLAADDAAQVYRLIGEAEAHVHGTTIEQIHFHEVGSLDALCDVTGCCLLFSIIGADAVYASPVHVGNGMVHCAHGILPVPAPATAELLKGIPFYTGKINSELCTPTGAAILKHFVTEFGAMPMMTTEQIGIGLGSKEFPAANCVRIFCGETESGVSDTVIDLSCNLDDMTGEALGYCMDILLDAGALDVFYQPIQMKKNRPGILLHCLCAPKDKEMFLRLIFTHTTTRGIRTMSVSRAVLAQQTEKIDTPYGPIRRKRSFGYGAEKSKYEYEDLKKAAMEADLPLSELLKRLL